MEHLRGGLWRGNHQSEAICTTLVKRAYFGEQDMGQRAEPPALEEYGQLLSVKQLLARCGHVVSDDKPDRATAVPLGRLSWE